MKEKVRKVLEILLIVFIVALSVVIFIFRDRLQNVSNVSYLGLFVLCLLANSTVLLPSPSLMIAASCALIMNPFLVALTAAAGSTCGELVGYLFGRTTQDLSPKFQKILDFLNKKIKRDEWIVFLLAVLPLPLFDIAGIYCGGTKMKVWKFFLICFAGKFIKTLVYTQIYDIIAWLTSFSGVEIPIPEL